MEKTTIEGYSFELEPLPAWQGLEVGARLAQVIGPMFGPIVKAVDGEDVAKLNRMLLLQLAAGALKDVNVGAMMEISKLLLAEALVQSAEEIAGKKLQRLAPVADILFKGKQLLHLKVIFWAIRVNFSGFIDGLKLLLPAPAPAAESKSPSTSAPAGQQPG